MFIDVAVQKNYKQAIIKSARELFQKDGFDNTGVSDICRIAKISENEFYACFKSKLFVFNHILKDELRRYRDAVITKLEEILNENLTPFEKIFKSMLYILKKHTMNDQFYKDVDKLENHEQSISRLIELNNENTYQMLRTLWSPKIAPDVDPEIGIPIIYKTVQKTIHTIMNECIEKQHAVLHELAKMVCAYLFRS